MWHCSPFKVHKLECDQIQAESWTNLLSNLYICMNSGLEKSLLKCSLKPVKGGLSNKRQRWELRLVAGVGASVTGLGELSQGGPWKHWISFSIPSLCPSPAFYPQACSAWEEGGRSQHSEWSGLSNPNLGKAIPASTRASVVLLSALYPASSGGTATIYWELVSFIFKDSLGNRIWVGGNNVKKVHEGETMKRLKSSTPLGLDCLPPSREKG